MNKAEDLMTKNPICLQVSDSVREALKVISQNKITSVPVKNEKGEVLGLLSELSLVKAMVVMRADRSGDKTLTEIQDFFEPVSFVEPGDSFVKVVQKLIGANVNRVLVRSEENILGIISPQDVLTRFAMEEI